MKQPGFSLLEFVISMMISAILMTASLTMYNQISKVTTKIQQTSSLDSTTLILYNRLNLDLQGICSLWFTPEHYEKLAELQKTDQAEIKNQLHTKQQVTTNERNNYFFALNNNDQLDVMTFVSNNPLPTYTEEQVRIVRIVYILEPDLAHPSKFKLMRKEINNVSPNFDRTTIKEGKFDQIADNIIHCSAMYGFIDQPPKQRSPDKELTITWTSSWGNANKDMKQNSGYQPAIPECLKLHLIMQPSPNKAPITYDLYCIVPINSHVTIKSFAEKRYYAARQAKKDPKSTDTTQASPPSSGVGEVNPESNPPAP